MRERRRDYELLFIISPLQSSEDQLTAATQRVQQIITNAGGEVTSVENSAPWGRRKFAYSIREYAEGEPSRRNFSEGFYVLVHFSAPSTALVAIERPLKLYDAVLRYLLTLVEQRGRDPLAVESTGESAAPAGGES
ncbi:MAG: 30S ribosomal protein S6 [Chloroflexales bacterium]|nr:30S ribosomal protein S6 [Chloroflexales bacterium]